MDTWRTADLLRSQCGAEALEVASDLANIALWEGQNSRCLDWLRVTRALERFECKKRRAGETVN